MVHKRKQLFKVVAAYDTETTNIKINSEWHAFTVCYQFNDISNCDLRAYAPNVGEHVYIYRTKEEALAFIQRCIDDAAGAYIPVIAGYNLMFDMQTLFYDLCHTYNLAVNAQSSTNVYTLDIVSRETILLRFWDTFHLEMNGLEAMGDAAGLYKLNGEWDYSLIRTPNTPLTPEEVAYATRDVQVIPAYLSYLLKANSWLTPEMLGCNVLTKTSLVRQMAKHEIAPLTVTSKRGKEYTLLALFTIDCREALPSCYYDYALQKACFRGGLTFTSARFASVVVENVVSLDAVSMHHLHINGHYLPKQFKPLNKKLLTNMVESILNTTQEHVLAHYEKPFSCAFHMRVKFKNLRLKPNTVFDAYGIALIPRGKFGKLLEGAAEYSKSEAAQEAELATRLAGWRDSAKHARFAFGKLYSAEECILHICECELWAISRAYEWDSIEPILGEGTIKFSIPPDYITLQSNVLFKRKQDMKHIAKTYKEGVSYEEEIPASIPEGIAEQLRTGALDSDFVKAYYQSTVKGMFNAIYGTQAQDVFKPDYEIADEVIRVNQDSVLNPDTFFDKLPKAPKVNYTYGLRIVAGSRVHLILAMELIYKALGERAQITGGDTDSMKIVCAPNVCDADLEKALEPLAQASKCAIDKTQRRIRENFPQLASDLKNIGAFEIENSGDYYAYHMEAWNKARVSIDKKMKTHITCAGVSRPRNSYHIESFMNELLKTKAPEEVLPLCLGYNVIINQNISHALQRTRPDFSAVFDYYVTDYLGNTEHVKAPEAIALYPCCRFIGDSDIALNAENITYVKEHYNREVDTTERQLMLNTNNKAVIDYE